MLRLPANVQPTGATTLPRYAKQVLLDVIAQAENGQPCPLDQRVLNQATQKCYVALTPAEEARLMALQSQHAGGTVEMSTFATQLVAGKLQPQPIVPAANQETHTLERLIDAGVIKLRNQQRAAYAHIRHALFDHRIGLTEAPTGVGKTIAYLSAARDLVIEKDQRVVIAFPKIALIEQCITEWNQAMRGLDDWQPDFILGKGEFVCAKVLQDMLDNDDGNHLPNADQVRQWVQDGAPARATSPLASRWLVKSLQDISPGFPTPTLHQERVDIDDEGLLSYQSQFERAHDAKLILVTHAMLATEIRHRYQRAKKEFGARTLNQMAVEFFKTAYADRDYKSLDAYLNDQLLDMAEPVRLPEFSYLIVDEVHTLEQTFSNVMSNNLSFHSLRAQLRAELKKGNAPKGISSVLAQTQVVFEQLRALAQPGNGLLDLKQAEYAAVIDALAGFGKAIDKVELPCASYAARTIEAMKKLVSFKNSIAAIEFSPSEHYPSLRVGLGKVTRYLDFLWMTMNGVSLISATISLPKPNGGDTDWYMRHILGLDQERSVRTDFCSISAPPWLTSPVTLMLPKYERTTEGEREFLRPVSHSDNWDRMQEEQRWLDEVAATIRFACDSAAGGSLVLCTAYETISGLRQRLAPLEDRLVIASSKIGVHQQKRDYMDRYAAGVRPIWLATGAAWTGLDLRAECDAQDDDLLTDLIMPRLPFGMNRSVTHTLRADTSKKMGFVFESFEMGYLSKQGMGRLVRREGIKPNRRLWILDNRVNAPKMGGITGIVKAMFNRYNDPVIFRRDEVMKLFKN